MVAPSKGQRTENVNEFGIFSLMSRSYKPSSWTTSSASAAPALLRFSRYFDVGGTESPSGSDLGSGSSPGRSSR